MSNGRNFPEDGLDKQNFNYQKQIALGEEAIARAQRAIHQFSLLSRYRDTDRCAGLRLCCYDPGEGSRPLAKMESLCGAREYGGDEDREGEIGKVTSDSARSERTGVRLSKAEHGATSAQELTVARVNGLSPTVKHVDMESPGANDTATQSNRRAEVDAYIQAVLRRTGERITRTAIWRAAGYKSRTEFERWERGDSRATKAAHRNFTRILSGHNQ